MLQSTLGILAKSVWKSLGMMYLSLSTITFIDLQSLNELLISGIKQGLSGKLTSSFGLHEGNTPTANSRMDNKI
jgi:hypothetical protein